jgi:hypothetical protein
MLISSIVMVLGFCTSIIFVPETLPSAAANTEPDGESESESDETSGLISGGDEDGDVKNTTNMRLRMKEQIAMLRLFGQWLRRNTRVVLMMLCFFAFKLGKQAGSTLLLQYAAKRLGWSLGKVRGFSRCEMYASC